MMVIVVVIGQKRVIVVSFQPAFRRVPCGG